MLEACLHADDERSFGEFRRKVKSAECLSAAMQNLLRVIRFSGKVSVIVQNGTILKSGYEEGYFRSSGLIQNARPQ
jgi:hypothetical protein